MSLELSVIVCTHNPRKDYLDRVLFALRQQTLAPEKWEFLIVDNASDLSVKSQFEISWHPNARHCFEANLGLTQARLRGINDSSGDILVFVDDDNVLHLDYLEQCVNIARNWPMLGAWGAGKLLPEFEGSPPSWTKPYWRLVGIGSLESDRWSNCWDGSTTPCGAGLCVRREVVLWYAEKVNRDNMRKKLDRCGDNLNSGGDTDLALTACDHGQGTAMFACLSLTHLIPSRRLTEEYLLRMQEAMAYSQLILAAFRDNRIIPIKWWRKILAYFRAWTKSGLQRRFLLASLRGQGRARRDLHLA